MNGNEFECFQQRINSAWSRHWSCEENEIVDNDEDNTEKFAVDALRRTIEELSLDHVQTLIDINLSNLRFSKLPTDVRLFANLEALDISQNNIFHLESEIIVLFLPCLKKCDISFNKIGDIGCIQKLGHLKFLEELNVQGNPTPVTENRQLLLQKLLFFDLSTVIVTETSAQRSQWLDALPELGLGFEIESDEEEDFLDQMDNSIHDERRRNSMIPELSLRPFSAPLHRRNSRKNLLSTPHNGNDDSPSKSPAHSNPRPLRRGQSRQTMERPLSAHPQQVDMSESLTLQGRKRPHSSLEYRNSARTRNVSSGLSQSHRGTEIDHEVIPSSPPSTLEGARHENVQQLRRSSSRVSLFRADRDSKEQDSREWSIRKKQLSRRYDVSEWSQVPLDKNLTQSAAKKILRQREQEKILRRKRPVYVDITKGVPPPNSKYRYISREELEERMQHFYQSFVPCDMRPFRQSLEKLNIDVRTKSFTERLKPLPVPRDMSSPFPMLSIVNNAVITIQDYLTAENEEIFDICVSRAQQQNGEKDVMDLMIEEEEPLSSQSIMMFHDMDEFANYQRSKERLEQQDLLKNRWTPYGQEVRCATESNEIISAVAQRNELPVNSKSVQDENTSHQHEIGDLEFQIRTLDQTKDQFQHDSSIVDMIERSARDELVGFDDYRTLKSQRKWGLLQTSIERPLDVNFFHVLMWEHNKIRSQTDAMLGVKRTTVRDFRPLKQRFLEMSNTEIELKLARMQLQQRIDDASAVASADKAATWKREFEQQQKTALDSETEFVRSHPGDPVSKNMGEMRRRLGSLFSRQWTDVDEYAVRTDRAGNRRQYKKQQTSTRTAASRPSNSRIEIYNSPASPQSTISKTKATMSASSRAKSKSLASTRRDTTPQQRFIHQRSIEQVAKRRSLSERSITLNGSTFKYNSLFV